MLEITIDDTGLGRRSHNGPALDVRGLVVDHVITRAGTRAFVEFGAHLTRDLSLDLLGELALLVLVIGPVERESQQRIAELIGVAGIQVHAILTPGEVLARQPNAGRAIPPFKRSLLPLRAPVGFARTLRHGAERPDGRVAIAAEGDHAQAEKPVFSAGESRVAVKIRDARAELAGSHERVERLIEKDARIGSYLVREIAAQRSFARVGIVGRADF